MPKIVALLANYVAHGVEVKKESIVNGVDQ
jgi:hypothetical protein